VAEETGEYGKGKGNLLRDFMLTAVRGEEEEEKGKKGGGGIYTLLGGMMISSLPLAS